jgi:hypothetical protein
MAPFRDLKAMVLRKIRKIHVPVGFLYGSDNFFVVNVGKSFEEKKREDVDLEV